MPAGRSGINTREGIEAMKRKVEIERAVMDYLRSKKILFFPVSPSAVAASGIRNGCTSLVGFDGMADLLAFYDSKTMGIIPVWLEIKSPGDKETLDQKHFRELVKSNKHAYILVTSMETVVESFEQCS